MATASAHLRSAALELAPRVRVFVNAATMRATPARSNFVPSLFLTPAARLDAIPWHAACSLGGAPSVVSRFGTPGGGRPP